MDTKPTKRKFASMIVTVNGQLIHVGAEDCADMPADQVIDRLAMLVKEKLARPVEHRQHD